MEVRYVIACEAPKGYVWLHMFLENLKVILIIYQLLTLYYDRSGVMAHSKELRRHKREKHIKHKYHLI